MLMCPWSKIKLDKFYYDYEVFCPVKHLTIYVCSIIILYSQNIQNRFIRNVAIHLILTVNCVEVILSAFYHHMHLIAISGIMLEIDHLVNNYQPWGDAVYFEGYSLPNIILSYRYIVGYSIWITIFAYYYVTPHSNFTATTQVFISMSSLAFPFKMRNYNGHNLWGSLRVTILSIYFVLSDGLALFL